MTTVAITEDECEAQQQPAYFAELKESVLDGVREIIRDAQPHTAPRSVANISEDPAVSNADVTDLELLTSELPAATSWPDYVTQYWTNNPACHQYRAGVDMLPHERKVHHCRLSRMKTVAEYVRDNYVGSMDVFERDVSAELGEELTINRIIAHIRSKERSQ